MLETAMRLCGADHAVISALYDGELSLRRRRGRVAPEYRTTSMRAIRLTPGAGTLVGRVALVERGIVQITDAWTDPIYRGSERMRAVGGVRTMLGVPLLRDGEPLGRHRSGSARGRAVHRQGDRASRRISPRRR